MLSLLVPVKIDRSKAAVVHHRFEFFDLHRLSKYEPLVVLIMRNLVDAANQRTVRKFPDHAPTVFLFQIREHQKAAVEGCIHETLSHNELRELSPQVSDGEVHIVLPIQSVIAI